MNRNSLPLTAIALAALLAGSGPARAASHDLATFIHEQDLNGDGKVSKEEFATGRDQEFARIDVNHDGGLSHDEYVADYRARLEQQLLDLPASQRNTERDKELKQAEVRFKVLDSDRSGQITPAEFAASGWGMFLHHDTNHDGVVAMDDATPPPAKPQ